MASPFDDLVKPALAARALLWANHVLISHPVAPERLKPHTGKRLLLQSAHWPLPFLAPPPMRVTITPAGLLEADAWADASAQASADSAGEPDLQLTLDFSDPWHLLEKLTASELPPIDIQGDAALAADVSWVIANVRWDVAGDVERLFGPLVAGQVQRTGAHLASAAHAALERARTFGERMRQR